MSATPDQLRAKHAWEVVERVKGSKDAKLFGGAARKLPVRIMASGLGQALAFLAAKGKTPELLKALSDWVLNQPKSGLPRFAVKADGSALPKAGDSVPKEQVKQIEEERQKSIQAWAAQEGRLLKSVIEGTADDLRIYTAEVLAYLQWLNRFCEANKLSDDTNSDGN